MRILLADMTKMKLRELPDRSDSGLSLALRLMDEWGESSIVLASPGAESINLANSSVVTISYTSPLSGEKSFSYANIALGLSLYNLGIKALVVIGRAPTMSYISLYPGREEILPSEHARGCDAAYFEEFAPRSKLDASISTSRSADNQIAFSVLSSKGKSLNGAGLGYAFSRFNLKGIVAQGFDFKAPIEKEALKTRRKTEKSRFARLVRKKGANVFIDDALRLAWCPINFYSSGFDPRAYALDGDGVIERYGNYPDSCQECFLSCGRRTQKGTVVPSWRETLVLGTNLGLFSLDSISPIAAKARETGLDAAVLGGLLSYFMTLSPDRREILNLKDTSVPSIVRFIEEVSSGRGVGAVLKDGLERFPSSVESPLHTAISFDLRGAWNQAITASMGLDLLLPAGSLIPKKPLQERESAIMAFWELIYSLALINYGFAPHLRLGVYFSKMPKAYWHIPPALRLWASRFSIQGFSSRDLLEKGLDIYRLLGLSMRGIPEIFKHEPGYLGRTVPIALLMDLFEAEVRRAEIRIKAKKALK